MNILDVLVKDKEIEEMREIIHEATDVWEGLLFWDGETIEQYRERLKLKVQEIKEKNHI